MTKMARETVSYHINYLSNMYLQRRSVRCCYDLYTCTHSYATLIIIWCSVWPKKDELIRLQRIKCVTFDLTSHLINTVCVAVVVDAATANNGAVVASIHAIEYLFNACMRRRHGHWAWSWCASPYGMSVCSEST